MKRLMFPLLLAAVCSTVVTAQPLVLDRTFATEGATRSNPGALNDLSRAGLLFPDGSLLLIGESHGGNNDVGIGMAWYQPNGMHDSAFSDDGQGVVKFNFRNSAYGLALQRDGKILAAGVEASSNAGSGIIPTVYRFNADGTADTSFGDTGRIARRFDPISGGIFFSVDTLPGGRIIAAGISRGNINGGINGFAVRRFLANGTPDGSYGSGGVALIVESPEAGVSAFVDLHERTVVAGKVSVASRSLLAVVRFDSTGQPDTSFGDLGKVVTGFEAPQSSGPEEIVALPGPNNTILLAATGAGPAGRGQFSVVRLTENGDPDSTFGTNGIHSDSLSTRDALYGMTLQSDGKILLAGRSGIGRDVAGLMRLQPNGALDTTFAAGGRLTIDLNGGAEANYAIKAFDQPDGRILLFGYDFANTGDFIVARLALTTSGVTVERLDGTGRSMLQQNSPNPASSASTICYQLTSTARVKLTIFDALGREVGGVAEATMSPGTHCLSVDCSSLLPGTYLYQLQVDDRVETKRMIVAR